MLQAMASPPNPSSPLSCKGGKRKPLEILSGIFSRKNREASGDAEERNNFFLTDESQGDIDMWDSSDAEGYPEPREALHSPYHARTIDQEMNNLSLSRLDNPFLQVLASREGLNESDEGSDEYEEKALMAKENLEGHSRSPLSLEEVHARLVRSPPPVMWTSYSETCSPGDSVFQFPPPTFPRMSTDPSPTHSCKSHASMPAQGYGRFLGPFKNRESTLDVLTAKFNLSPQPRRRPSNKSRPYSDFTSS